MWRNLIRFADALKRLAGTAHPSPADRAARALFWALPPALRRRLVLDRLANKSYAYAASPLAAWGGACGGGEGAAEPGRRALDSVAQHLPPALCALARAQPLPLLVNTNSGVHAVQAAAEQLGGAARPRRRAAAADDPLRRNHRCAAPAPCRA